MATQEILWERTDGDITVILAATPYKDNNGVTQQHLPSGRIARENSDLPDHHGASDPVSRHQNLGHLAGPPE